MGKGKNIILTESNLGEVCDILEKDSNYQHEIGIHPCGSRIYVKDLEGNVIHHYSSGQKISIRDKASEKEITPLMVYNYLYKDLKEHNCIPESIYNLVEKINSYMRSE